MDMLLDVPGQGLIGAIGWLDSLPGYVRAMLASLLLVTFLRFFERRISRQEVLYGQSFRKTALVVLVLVPMLVWLVPSSRMVVFVEELPVTGPSDHWTWRSVLALWAAGCLVALTQLVRAHRRDSRELMTAVEDDKLLARLDHWQRRLGLNRSLTLVYFHGDLPRQLLGRTTVGLPAAAGHWPGGSRDVVLIQALCHLKQRHGGWHLIAQLVTCLYWPISWVQTLHENLLADFQRSADELAGSCYQDRLGYDRALRQLQQRLAIPSSAQQQQASALGWSVAASWVGTWGGRMRRLLAPEPEPRWNLDALLAEREAETTLIWTDPYDKVVLFVGQAMFLAFLLTGVTLKEKPPEVEQDYAMPFALLWKEHFYRNQELVERTQREP